MAVGRDFKESRFPKSPLARVDSVVKNVVISEVGGVPVITAFEHLATSTYSNGETFKHRSSVQLSNLSLSPSKDLLELTTKIPDGARVKVNDARDVNATWQAGEVVKTVDQKAIRHLSYLDIAE